MAEQKRIQLVSAIPAKKHKSTKKIPPTLRFNLTLEEAQKDTCTEVSFSELLKSALGKESKDKKVGDGLPPNEDREALYALAKSFEEKYGKPAKHSKYRDKLNDHVDLGDGYDTEDPFIDNDEAYDEFVPACLTTTLGGFYINTGKLDFKNVQSEDDDFKVHKKRKKRLVITDSDEDIKRDKFKKHKLQDGERKKKRKLSSTDRETILKRKKLKKFKKSMSSGSQKGLNSLDVHQNGLSSVSLTEDSNSSKVLASDPLRRAQIDSTIDAVISTVITEDSNEKPASTTSLPDDLPTELEAKLDQIKNAAVVSDVAGYPKRFFTTPVNTLLLDIDTQTKKLSANQRSVIYSHLAGYLPGSKETLIKRAKKLRLNVQYDELKKPIEKLQNAVNAEMPEQSERYQAEYQKFKENLKTENTSRDVKEDIAALSADSEEEEDKPADKTEDITPTGSAEKTDKKRILGPRKKFEWTPEIRSLLCEVVTMKMKWYDISKGKGQTAEEYLKMYLDADIKQLWPKGWMQTRMLFKESRAAHSPWTTTVIPKVKKTIPLNIKTQATPFGAGDFLEQTVTTNDSCTTSTNMQYTATSGSIQKQVPTLLDYADQRYSQKAKGSNAGVSSKVSSSEHAKPGCAPVSQTKQQTFSTNLTADQFSALMNTSMAGTLLKNLGILSQAGSFQSASVSPAVAVTKSSAATEHGKATPATVTSLKSLKPTQDNKDFIAAFKNFASSSMQQAGNYKEGDAVKVNIKTTSQPSLGSKLVYEATNLGNNKQTKSVSFPSKAKSSTGLTIPQRSKSPGSIVYNQPISSGQGQLMKSSVTMANQQRLKILSVSQPVSKAHSHDKGQAVKIKTAAGVHLNAQPVVQMGPKVSTTATCTVTLPRTTSISLLSGKPNARSNNPTASAMCTNSGHSIHNILRGTASSQVVPSAKSTSSTIVQGDRHKSSRISPSQDNSQIFYQKRPHPSNAAELYAQKELSQAIAYKRASQTKSPISPAVSQMWNVLTSPVTSGYGVPYSSSVSTSPSGVLPHTYQHTNSTRLEHQSLQRSPVSSMPNPMASYGAIPHSPVSPHSPMHGMSPHSPIRRPSPQGLNNSMQQNHTPYGNHYADTNRQY